MLKVPPASSFTGWVRQIIHERRKRMQQPARDPIVMAAIDAGIDESVRSGTAVVGEITNTLFVPFEKLAQSPLAGVVFWELIGFNTDGDFDVDGNDLLNWQRGYGSAGAVGPIDGDVNASGAVDEEDLALIKKHFGRFQPAVAAVPEPTSMALSVVALLLVKKGRGNVKTRLTLANSSREDR